MPRGSRDVPGANAFAAIRLDCSDPNSAESYSKVVDPDSGKAKSKPGRVSEKTESSCGCHATPRRRFAISSCRVQDPFETTSVNLVLISGDIFNHR